MTAIYCAPKYILTSPGDSFFDQTSQIFGKFQNGAVYAKEYVITNFIRGKLTQNFAVGNRRIGRKLRAEQGLLQRDFTRFDVSVYICHYGIVLNAA